MKKIGIQMSILFFIGFWEKLRASARMSLRLRNAVSPEVIGQTTMPRIAIIAPVLPSQLSHIAFTIMAGVFPLSAIMLSCSGPPKYAIAAVAQMQATTPSAIIAP